MNDDLIGIAKKYIKKGEVTAKINMFTGEVTSDNLEFVEGGRARLLSWVGCRALPQIIRGEKIMKFKMFYFSAIQGIGSIEEEINRWLAEYHNLEIKHFSQSETSDEEGGLTVSIFYEEK